MSMSELPPYVPYKTFKTFLGILAEEGIPTQIDRSFWGAHFSGSSGYQLISALKTFQLVDEKLKPTKRLDKLVAARGFEFSKVLASLLKSLYHKQFEIDLERCTKSQFSDSFKVYIMSDKVRNKCESFFINAANDAGIPLSKYILEGRLSSNRKKVPREKLQVAQFNVKHTPHIDIKVALAELLLKKLPDFDPTWPESVQKAWLLNMEKIHSLLTDKQ